MKGLKPRFLLKVLGSHDGFSSEEAGVRYVSRCFPGLVWVTSLRVRS